MHLQATRSPPASSRRLARFWRFARFRVIRASSSPRRVLLHISPTIPVIERAQHEGPHITPARRHRHCRDSAGLANAALAQSSGRTIPVRTDFRPSELALLLAQPIAVRDFANPMTLKEFIGQFTTHYRTRYRAHIPIIV